MVAYIVNQVPTYVAFFRAAKVGKTGLTVTVTVRRGGAVLVSAAAATEVGDGWYSYTGGGSSVAGVCTAIFHTADATVDAQDVEDRAYFGMAVTAGITQDAGLPGGLPLTKDIIQRFMKTLYGARGTVWFVHPDGVNTNDGLSPATAIQTPNQKGTDGSGPALSGDLVYIMDDVPITAVFKLPDGVSLRGGINSRLRQTTAATNCVEVGSNNLVSDLSIAGTLRAIVNNGRALANSRIERVRCPAVSGADFLYFNGAAISDTIVRDIDCIAESNQIFLTGCSGILQVERYRGRALSVGSGLFSDSAVIFAKDVWVYMPIGGSTTINAAGGVIEIVRCRSLSGGFDLMQSAGGTIFAIDVSGSGVGGTCKISATAPDNILFRDTLGGSEWELNGTVAAATSATSFTLSAEFPATTDALKYQSLVFLSGALKGQTRRIDGYTAGRVATFVRGFTATPTAGDRVKVIGVVE